MTRENKFYLLSDTGRDCSHGAWADGKQTHFPLMKICAEKAPNARVRGATRWLTSWLIQGQSQQRLRCLQIHLPNTWALLKVRSDSYKLPKTQVFLEAWGWKCLPRHLKSKKGNSFKIQTGRRRRGWLETYVGERFSYTDPGKACNYPKAVHRMTTWPLA